jgi:hypothetical protein
LFRFLSNQPNQPKGIIMKYPTQIRLWTKLGHTPVTGRSGPYYDELLHTTVLCENPAEATALVRKLIQETEHADSGYFRMPEYPNHNINSRFIN